MRVALTIRRPALVLAAFAFSLIALLPLRVAMAWLGAGDYGLAAREASGSVWLGALKEAQLGPVPLGDVTARLNSLPLLLGRARISLTRESDADPFEGAVTMSRHSFGFDDISGRLRLGPLLAPLPVSSLELQDVSGGFSRGRCTRAAGMVRAAVAGEVSGIGTLSGFSGNPRCAEGALLLPLVSQTGLEQLDIRLFADGRYRVALAVRPADAAAQTGLAAAGFRPAGGFYVLSRDGRF